MMHPDDVLYWRSVFPATTELGRRLADLTLTQAACNYDRESNRETAQNEEWLAEWLWEST